MINSTAKEFPPLDYSLHTYFFLIFNNSLFIQKLGRTFLEFFQWVNYMLMCTKFINQKSIFKSLIARGRNYFSANDDNNVIFIGKSCIVIRSKRFTLPAEQRPNSNEGKIKR